MDSSTIEFSASEETKFKAGLYHRISLIKPLKKFSHKFFAVAFLGVHIPLLGAVFYVMSIPHIQWTNLLLVLLIMTIAATLTTIYALNKLLHPVSMVCSELEKSVVEQRPTQLPGNYDDEIGMLMRLVNDTSRTQMELLREKADTVSLVTHDLRTPASQIIGLAQLLRDTDAEEEREELLGEIERSARYQLGFLEEMLGWMQSDRGKVQKSVNLTEMVDASVKQVSARAGSKQVKIQTDVGELAQCADVPGSVQNILENLLTNALKFSFRKGEVSLRVRRAGQVLYFEVKDKGCGFCSADATRLFERFSPSGRKGTEGESSSGIGLYLSRKLAQKFRGDIYASSKGKNQGATFTLNVPVA